MRYRVGKSKHSRGITELIMFYTSFQIPKFVFFVNRAWWATQTADNAISPPDESSFLVPFQFVPELVLQQNANQSFMYH